MPILGLTGGVATGKSTFARLLLRELEMGYFDADRCVHEVLAADPAARDQIRAVFGDDVLSPEGWPERAKLRSRIYGNEQERKALEQILHPIVRRRWTTIVTDARKTGAWQLVDIPLLYESGVQAEFDRIIVVAAPRLTQLRRLVQERNLAATLAERIIAAQMDIGTKVQSADHLIWNDSTVSNLDGQSRLLAAWLKRRYA